MSSSAKKRLQSVQQNRDTDNTSTVRKRGRTESYKREKEDRIRACFQRVVDSTFGSADKQSLNECFRNCTTFSFSGSLEKSFLSAAGKAQSEMKVTHSQHNCICF